MDINKVPDLYRLAYMPGVFSCPQCGFQLSKQTMSMSAGVIGVSESDRETEECPNDGTMMVPVTYREQLAAYESRLFQELDAKDAQNQKVAALEQFMVRVAKELGCLPSFSDPANGNEHIFRKLAASPDAQGSVTEQSQQKSRQDGEA